MTLPTQSNPSWWPSSPLGYAFTISLVLAALAPGWALAMVYAPISDADLFEKSDRVVLGEVVEVRPAPDARTPSMDYVVWVSEEFRAGSPQTVSQQVSSQTVTVRVPGGGRGDGVAMWIPGTPQLRVGERLLLFLADAEGEQAKTGETLARLSEHTLGLFYVVDLPDRQLAVRALGDAAKIFTAETHGQAAKGLSRSVEAREEWPRDLEGFTAWMRSGAGDDYEVDPVSLGSSYADKFTLLTSRVDTEFGGCGEDGGRPVRLFTFDDPEPSSFPWRLHLSLPVGAIEAFREALAAWSNDPASKVNLSFEGLTTSNGLLDRPDGVSTVRFDDPFNHIPGEFDGSGVLAIGGPWFYCRHSEYRGQEFHEITEGDILMQNGVPEAFQATPWPDRLMVQVLSHELGHTLGIGHTDAPQALMQASLHVDPRGAAFEPDDLAALEYLYGEGPDAASSPPSPDRPEVATGRGPFVYLSWPPVDGASNYRIEKRRVPDGWFPLTSVFGTEFEDIYVDPEATYQYRLRSQNAAGASGASVQVRVVAGPEGTPAAPSQVRAYPVDAGTVGLRWQSNSCEIDMHNLEIDSGEGFRTVRTALAGTDTELIVTGLRPEADYGFRMTAENRWGRSLPSEAALIEALGQGACIWRPDSPHLCLDQRRFQVTLEYWDEAMATWQDARPRPEDAASGFFWFYDAANLEVGLSVDSSAPDGPTLRWTSLTDRVWRAEVDDTVTGESWSTVSDSGLCVGSFDLKSATTLSKHEFAKEASWHLSEIVADEPTIEGSAPAAKDMQPEIPCGRAATDLFLDDGRFRARLDWWDDDGVRRSARALDLTDVSGAFEISTTDEVGWLVKLLDGTGLNGRYWLFAGPTHVAAPYEAELSVRDLEQGVTRIYRRGRPNAPAGVVACSVADIGAFDG